MSSEFFVYMVQCADGTLYSGYTTNVQKRIDAHNAKRGAKYTKSRLPVTLKYAEKCENKSEALKREHKLKALTRKQKLLLCQSFNATNFNNTNLKGQNSYD